MSISIYYPCERNTLMSHEEQQQVNTIINRYNNNFELKEIGETFQMPQNDSLTPHT